MVLDHHHLGLKIASDIQKGILKKLFASHEILIFHFLCSSDFLTKTGRYFEKNEKSNFTRTDFSRYFFLHPMYLLEFLGPNDDLGPSYSHLKGNSTLRWYIVWHMNRKLGFAVILRADQLCTTIGSWNIKFGNFWNFWTNAHCVQSKNLIIFKGQAFTS